MSDEKGKLKFLPDFSISQFLGQLGVMGIVGVIFGQIAPDDISKIRPSKAFIKNEPKIIPINKNAEIHQHINDVLGSNEPSKTSFWKRAETDFTRGVIDGLIIYTVLYSIQEGIQLASRLLKKRGSEATTIVENAVQQTVQQPNKPEPISYRDDWRDKMANKGQEQNVQTPTTPVRG